jgi:hypothetical protein
MLSDNNIISLTFHEPATLMQPVFFCVKKIGAINSVLPKFTAQQFNNPSQVNT